jgi:hypothetical protein
MARVHNVLFNSNIPGKATLQAWNQETSYPNLNVAKIHAFGHVGYTHTQEQKRVTGDKFTPRAIKAHLGGLVGDRIYRLWMRETDKVVTTASVKFETYGTKDRPDHSAPPPHGRDCNTSWG